MPCRKYGDVCCFSCHFNCVISSTKTIKMITCNSNRYCLWPESNLYLKLGLEVSIISSRYNLTHNGLIFIDFSSQNAKLYSNKGWLDYLTQTGMQLVLLPDKEMKPLAAYWKKRSSLIVAVINPDDTKSEIEKKVSSPFYRARDSHVYRNNLSDIEVKTLDLMFSDKSIKQISEILELNIKKIYDIKRSLQLKMGGKGRLNAIISK